MPDKGDEMATNIRLLRAMTGDKASDLAASMGISPGYFSLIESGRRQAPAELRQRLVELLVKRLV